MKISCPTCSAKYSVADEKIQSRLAKIRCRKCSSTIVIDGTASPAKVYVGDASAAISPSAPPQDMEASPTSGRSASSPAPGMSEPVGPAPDEYAVDIADNDQRNMTIHQIVGAYNEGLITADTYIWKEGMADWQTLAEVRDVANALHAAARPAAAAQPAAVRRSNHNSSADLFGRIHTAGGEEDITTSAPEPAPAMTAGTGARNESSVLFSLSALTGSATATAAAPAGSAKKRSSDDSGLIDLQALTAADAAGGGAAAGGFGAAPGAFGASPLISAPLGGVSGPALGGGLGAGYGGRSGGRWGLIAAALLLAVVMIGGTLVFVKGGGNDPEPPTSSLAAAPEPAPTKEATPREAPKEEAAPTPDPSGSDTAVGTTRPVAVEELPTAAAPDTATAKPAPKPATPRTPRPAAPKPSAAAVPPAPPPVAEPMPAAPKPVAPKPAAPAVDPAKKRCDCKPADLLCAMKCSAKKP